MRVHGALSQILYCQELKEMDTNQEHNASLPIRHNLTLYTSSL